MKKQSVFKKYGVCLCLLVALLSGSGCVAVSGRQKVIADDNSSAVYRSELADHDAKAFFAFSEFRLFGADNRWDEALAALERAIDFDPQSDYLRLLLAKVYLHRQQPELAMATLNVLFGRDFNNVAAHELLGDIYNYQRNHAAALDQFRLVLELQPESEIAQLRFAMTLVLLERKDEAIIALEKFLQHHSDAVPAQLTLARLYVGKKQIEKATYLYQKLFTVHPEHWQAALEYGMLLETVDPDAARDLYLVVIEHNPGAAAVRQRLGQYLLDRQQLDGALQQFQAVLHQFPDNRQTIKRIGLIYLEQKNWSAAEKSFRALVTAEIPQDISRYYLSMALSAQKKTEAAIEVLAPFVATAKLHPEAALQLAYLYNKVARVDEAIATLQWLLENNIHRPDVYYYLTAFFSDRGDDPEALEVALVGVEKNPRATQLQYQLGVLYAKSGNRNAAVAVMEGILLLDDAYADALNFLAYDQAENGINLELALSRVQKALALMPTGYVVDTLGWVYFKMGRYAESRKQLEKAIGLYPADVVIREHLGDLYRAMNLFDEAATAYRQVLEIAPQTKPVIEKLRLILLEKQ
ncbi:MAG: tetratricopeptide repeat protein [Desulfuromonadales bacterium]|nr:tetratricopeptide repeat protein [Desulfuromonadales bacterium]